MKLSDYLEKKKLSVTEFSELVKIEEWTVRRYLAGRVPERKKMERIYSATSGKVTPNDFYHLVVK